MNPRRKPYIDYMFQEHAFAPNEVEIDLETYTGIRVEETSNSKRIGKIIEEHYDR